MWSLSKMKWAAGPLWWDVVTTPQYKEQHPRCHGGDGQFRYLAWHGDKLLDLVVVERLLSENGFSSDNQEALKELDKRKMKLASRKYLAQVAEALKLSEAVRHVGVPLSEDSYSEMMEALITAVYKHSGDEVMRQFVHENIISPTAQLSEEDDSVRKSEAAPPNPDVPEAGRVGWRYIHKITPSLPPDIRERIVRVEHDTHVLPSSQARLWAIRKILWKSGFLRKPDPRPKPSDVDWNAFHRMVPDLPEDVRSRVTTIEHDTDSRPCGRERLALIKDVLVEEDVLKAA